MCSRISELSVARIVQVTKFEIDFALSEEVDRKCLRYHNSTFSLCFQISIDCLSHVLSRFLLHFYRYTFFTILRSRRTLSKSLKNRLSKNLNRH